VRDAQHFQLSSVVEHELRTEVGIEQLADTHFVKFRASAARPLRQFVRDLLELGEHRLPDDRLANVVDLAVEVGRCARGRPWLAPSGSRLSNCSLNVLATSATKIV
jgi:hypothetical protein